MLFARSGDGPAPHYQWLISHHGVPSRGVPGGAGRRHSPVDAPGPRRRPARTRVVPGRTTGDHGDGSKSVSAATAYFSPGSGAGATPVGQDAPQFVSNGPSSSTPVPPSPQYPAGFLSRYCWWYASAG